MLTDGLQIMLVGMGTVFILLIVIVLATQLASAIIRGLGLDAPAAAPAGGVPPPAPKTGPVAAAIAAALARFHRDRASKNAGRKE